MNRHIKIDTDLCIGCNICGEVCDQLYEASGHYSKTEHRPAFLHCIYCMGDCVESCDQHAIMLVDESGPHTVLCRVKGQNNFINL